ncbi:endonuclease domain-containing protein [Halocola ammonii]
MPSNENYNKHLRDFARENRDQMTKAEACLWKCALSRRKMLGYRFKRQRPVDWYIVDFMCPKLGLIIEVDGYSHSLEEIQKKDKVRQGSLEALGFTVIRFNDEDVLRDISHVRYVIQKWIEELEKGKN